MNAHANIVCSRDNAPDSEALAAIGPLRDAGFALHWSHPRSKRPIGDGWSSAPVASLEDLRRTHSPGNNLGVRTGEPSAVVSGGYLHVLDIDIRVRDTADEAWATLAALFPSIDFSTFPTVASGSGGESRHIYFVTEKPFFSKKLAVSDEKFRGADGKWHYTFEIELFGTGKQVAMPPSIHPDSGKPYTWLRPFDLDALAFGESPSIPASAIERLSVAQTATYEFENRPPLEFKPGQMERDLAALPVSRLDDYHDWVTLGQALHHQFGGLDEGFDIWVAQSRRSEKFDDSATGLRDMRRKYRGFGKSRRQPVTMASVRQWSLDERAAALVESFDDLPDATPATATAFDDFDALLTAPAAATVDDDLAAFDLTPEETAAAAVLSWTSLLHVNEEGAIRPTLHNLRLIVLNDPRLAGLAQINEFTQETVQRTPPGTKQKRRANAAKETRQLTGRVWEVKDTLNGELWSDDRDFDIRSALEAPETQGGYGIKVSDRDLKAAIVLAANEHAFHPVREYLERVVWDGVPRAEQLFQTYLNAPDDAYHRDVSRLVLVAAVTRIFEPGAKFDFATILEGIQGKRKSTFIQVLARSWFGELEGEFSDSKVMIEMMQGKWILEIPELTGFGRADVRAIKAFISRQRDRARMAYARRAGEFPRQCIFIGSTNDHEYLKDDTGGRRFWPVRCALADDEEIDTDQLLREVDQLWAEAVCIYRTMREKQPHGTLPLYLKNKDARAIAAQMQQSRQVQSVEQLLAGRFAEWLDTPVSGGGFDDLEGAARSRTCLSELWTECLQRDLGQYAATSAAQLGRAMKMVPGWEADGKASRFGKWGVQRGYTRIIEPKSGAVAA